MMIRTRRSLPLLILAGLVLALPAHGQIVINEIMYNSLTGVGGQDVEYVELINTGTSSINLDGWYLLDDDLAHPRCYLAGTLDGGEILVVAADLVYFSLQYPTVTNVNINGFDPGGLGFGLGNSGDTVQLFDSFSTSIDAVTYDDGLLWPGSPDGNGPSLELLNPLLDNSLPTSWDPSLADWGTPGSANSVFTPNAAPICKDGLRSVPLPGAGETVGVAVTAFDPDDTVTVTLHYDLGLGSFVSTPMYDDGLHLDGVAGDSIFGATIPGAASGTLVRYYCLARDPALQVDTWPNDAPLEFESYTVDHVVPALRISEVQASNVTGPVDEGGVHEDWVEIENIGDVTVNLDGMYLSDNLTRTREWMLPALNLEPGGLLLIWADNEPLQGLLHASFRLSAGGEEIGLFDTRTKGNTLIDGYAFGPLGDDRSYGYIETGDNEPEYLAAPSPGAPNAGTAPWSDVCINEFHTTSAVGGVDDWVELHNRGPLPVTLDGWMISDRTSDPTRYVIPPGTELAAGGYLSIDEVALGFGFSSTGGEVILITAADSVTTMAFFPVGPQQPDRSYGRSPDGGGYWDILSLPTPGGPNAGIVAAPAIPSASALHYRGAWPNPFNPATRIHFTLDRATTLSVALFDVSGRQVRGLHAGRLPAGEHELRWDGRDDAGRPLASGLYLMSLESSGVTRRDKLILLK